MSKSTVIFRHELSESHKDKNENKFTTKQTIIDGAKGLSFFFLNKDPKNFYRIVVKEEEPGNFTVKEKVDDKDQPEKKMNMTDLLKILKGEKFDFIRKYIEKDRAKYRKALEGGRKKRSSKKSSKKRSSKKKMTGGRKKRSSKKSSKKRSSKKMVKGFNTYY
jgi:hypothetical protein